MKRNIFILSAIFLLGFTTVFAQITAPTADYFEITEYKNPSTNQLLPVEMQDSVYVFCSDDLDAGQLIAPLSAGCSYEWGKYVPSSSTYTTFANTPTVSNLQSGGYQVRINCDGEILTYRAWVFVNQTIVEVADLQGVCSAFNLNGTASPVTDFTIYNPPEDPFIIDATTEITVCFTADHTFVSDLGFYLVAPTYGPNCDNPAEPGDFGIVELLPSIADYDNVTNLPQSFFGCDGDYFNWNCNDNDNVVNLCFTTEKEASNPAHTLCVGEHEEIPSVPLTGTYASTGPWSTIYGTQVPAASDVGVNCGWTVQIYDCIDYDYGYFTNATISFSQETPTGTVTHYYDSGNISSAINDNSCSANLASIFEIPSYSYQYTVANTVQYQWSANPTVTIPNATTSLTPLIDPQPSVPTWFYLSVTDYVGGIATGCTKVDSTLFQPISDNIQITSVGPFCELESNVYLEANTTGGVWTSTPGSLIAGASTGLINSAASPGLYDVIYTVSNGNCSYADTAQIEIKPKVFMSNLSVDCINANDHFKVCFDATGAYSGTLNFTINDTLKNENFDGTTFCDTLESPNKFVFEIDNGTGCNSILDSIYHDCGCGTFAGIMNQTEIYACDGDIATATLDSAFHTDGNDILWYYLHTGNLYTIANPIDSNTTGIFTDANVTYGVQYYISSVAADSLIDGHIDWTDFDCLDISQGTPVTWVQRPDANIVDNSLQICGKSIGLEADSVLVGQGSWSSYDAPGTTSFLPYNDSQTPTVVVPTTGQYHFVWTVDNNDCIDKDTITVSFIPTPVANAGSDTYVCGNSYTLVGDLDLPLIQTSGFWTMPSSDITEVVHNDSSSTVTVTEYGTYLFTFTEAAGGGLCSDDDYVSIRFIRPPQPDANHTDSICGQDYTLNALNTINGSWAPITGLAFLPTVSDPQASVSINLSTNDSTVWFHWTEISSECSATDSVAIVFAKPPVASIDSSAGNTTTIVCGNTAILVADITGTEYAQGTWSSNLSGVVFSNVDSAYTSMTIPGNYYGEDAIFKTKVFWMMRNAGCSQIDTVTITFYQEPEPDAGIDTVACGLDIVMNAEYSLGDGSNAYGQWSNVAGQFATIDDNDNPNSVIHADMGYGVYHFVWTETNVADGAPSCSRKDTIEVEFISVPFPDAGDDISHCGKENICLDATPSGVADSAFWVTKPGVDYIANGGTQSQPNTCVNVGNSFVGTTFYLYWREYQDICVVEDSVQITVVAQPSATYDAIDTEICGNKVYNLKGNNPGTGSTAYWYDLITGTTFIQNNHYSNPDTAIVNTYGLHQLYWYVEQTIGNTTCSDTSDELVLNFRKVPTPQAHISGQDLDTTCGHYYALQGVQSIDTSTVIWLSNDAGNISFLSTSGATGNVINDTVYYSQINQVKNIYLVEANGNGCITRDTISVMFSKIPSGEFSYTQAKCYHDASQPFTFEAYEDTLPRYDWGFDGGTVAYETGQGTDEAGPYDLSWEEDSLHEVYLVAYNSYNCPSDTVKKDIYEPAKLSAYFSVLSALCNGNTGMVSANPTLGGVDYDNYDAIETYWLPDPQISSPYNFTQSNMYSGSYQFKIEDDFCRAVETVVIPDSGLVTAAFEVTDTSGVAEYEACFYNKSDNADSAEWHFNNEETFYQIVKETSPCFTYEHGGEFWVRLISTSTEGCKDTAYYEFIHVEAIPDVEAPNVFTPNGDNVNDKFTIKTETLESFEGYIFNRWGRKVYEWSDVNDEGWDGTINGGAKAAPGVYYYIIKAVGSDPDATEFELKGNVTLIRD
ncbi:MAG TPA: hypothetical protein DDX39_02220 [Bacteroidales bacterium]|nr:MAG: hypothetical protein A2W98_08840 [Bacteroidetes bacterium GWF2_33_38]HBF87430.1 hypothetical protein [Bacteroidales bacterium]